MWVVWWRSGALFALHTGDLVDALHDAVADAEDDGELVAQQVVVAGLLESVIGQQVGGLHRREAVRPARQQHRGAQRLIVFRDAGHVDAVADRVDVEGLLGRGVEDLPELPGHELVEGLAQVLGQQQVPVDGPLVLRGASQGAGRVEEVLGGAQLRVVLGGGQRRVDQGLRDAAQQVEDVAGGGGVGQRKVVAGAVQDPQGGGQQGPLVRRDGLAGRDLEQTDRGRDLTGTHLPLSEFAGLFG